MHLIYNRMRYLKRYEDNTWNPDGNVETSRDSSDIEREITIGSIVKHKSPPREDLRDAPFIVKVDGQIENPKANWVIMYQLEPDVTDDEIREIIKTPHYVLGDPGAKEKFQQLPGIKDFLPVNIQKWRIEKIRQL